jgi:hypothetical protein
MEKDNGLYMNIQSLYDGVVEMIDETVDILDDCEVGSSAHFHFTGRLEVLEIIKDAVEAGTF